LTEAFPLASSLDIRERATSQVEEIQMVPPIVTLSGNQSRTVAVMVAKELEHVEFSLEYAKNEAATHRMARIRERAGRQILQLESRRAVLAQAWTAFSAAGFDR
jgi:hypothetical protein